MSLNDNSEDDFVAPGIVKVAAPAFELACEFGRVVRAQKGDWIVTFDWAENISVRHSPDAAEEPIGPCLTLSAYERHQIPTGFIETIDGMEFAIRIPTALWKASERRLIELDESLLFRLALR
jgi:hypothetical protein